MSALSGSAALLRTSFKHELKFFLPWIAIALVFSPPSVTVYPEVFPDQASRDGLATAVGSNPAVGLIFGPAYDLSTVDGFNAWRSLTLVGFLTALGMIFMVVKASRKQEDTGQGELLASGVMGRPVRLFTGVILALTASTLVGVISGVVTGLVGGGWEASMLLAATFTATGWMFAGVASITAQLASDARTANTLAVSTLGVLFLLRGFAYAMDWPEWTVWANPLGWMTEARPATGDHWWTLLLAVAFTAVTLAIGFTLQARRGFGEATIPPRPGPARGKTRSSLGLAVRLGTGSAVTWVIAFAVLGVVFGYFAASVHDIVRKDSTVAQILAAGAVTADQLVSDFMVTILSVAGVIASISGVQAMLRIRTEETEGRLEALFSTALSRGRYMASNAVVAFTLPAILMLIVGLEFSFIASRSDVGIEFGDAFVQVLATIPAVWTVVALAIALVGLHPNLALAAWIGPLASLLILLLGPTFDFPDAALAISPFWHIPNVTEGDPGWGLVWISVVTLVFAAVGFVGFRRRDLH